MAQQIAEILKGIGDGVGTTLRLCNMLSLWEKVVDERVGKHTRASKIRNRVLYVSTSSPSWAQELSFFKNEFVKKFNMVAGSEIIRDIKFRAGGF